MSRYRRLVMATTVAVLVAGVSVAGAVTTTRRVTTASLGAHAAGPTGNATAIAFMRRVALVTQASSGATYTYAASAAFDQLKFASGGSWNVFSGLAAQPGFSPVNDVLSIGARAGRITFVLDTMAWAGKGPTFAPFAELLTTTGEAELTGNVSASTTRSAAQGVTWSCAGPVHGAVAGYNHVGSGFGYGIDIHFVSLHRVGTSDVVVSTYPYGHGQVATETDVINRSTYLPISGRMAISAAPGYGAFTMAWRVSWYHATLYPPRTTSLCKTIESGITG